MSLSCRLVNLPLTALKPDWVEFTQNKGVLRVLKPKEDNRRARGLVFECPKCGGDKLTAHQLVFLFDLMGTADEVRPHGRFTPNFRVGPEVRPELPPFNELTLHESPVHGQVHAQLRPRDTRCGWVGYITDGKVSWRPGVIEPV